MACGPLRAAGSVAAREQVGTGGLGNPQEGLAGVSPRPCPLSSGVGLAVWPLLLQSHPGTPFLGKDLGSDHNLRRESVLPPTPGCARLTPEAL